jgi:hypothetical protein
MIKGNNITYDYLCIENQISFISSMNPKPKTKKKKIRIPLPKQRAKVKESEKVYKRTKARVVDENGN